MTSIRKDHDDHAPDRPMVEIIRQREALKYASNIISNIVTQEHGTPDLSRSRAASDNTTLTAFALLCACQTGTARCMISFFDQKYQYVVAEATPALPLVPGVSHEDLLFCGTAFPRRQGICEHALFKPNQFSAGNNDDHSHLPLLVLPDLMEDEHFDAQSKPCAVADPEEPTRFYAAVPIQTAKGVNIGVVSVMCPFKLTTWSDTHRQVLRNISGSIMSYLEGNRVSARTRSQRMNKGISAFMEENFNLAGSRLRPQAGDLADTEPAGRSDGSPDPETPPSRDTESSADEPGIFSFGEDVVGADTPPSVVSSDDNSTDDSSQPAEPAARAAHASFFEADPESARKSTIQSIFTNAAEKICQAMDTDGCLFLDAAPQGFGAIKSMASLDPLAGPQSSASTSSDEGTDASGGPGAGGGGGLEPCATVLGFATSESRGGGEPEHITRQAAVAARLLASFIKRYPRGKLFNFDGNEELNPTDSSEGDPLSPLADSGATRHGGYGRHRPRGRPIMKPWVKRNEGRDILRVFPGARSVAFVPVWDPRKNRWFAGGFVYSRHPRQTFTVDAELSYLRVLCILAMTETMRHELTLDEKAKFDALSSMSHELRSPLHGIILGIEMLNETDMTVSQGDTVHTLEACGRTLTDTLDHLLDYAKVNNFQTTARPLARGITQTRSIQAGMMTLRSNVHIDVLAEEVMDSIFAGFNFQYLSIAQLKKLDGAMEPDVAANHHLDGMRAEEELGHGHGHGPGHNNAPATNVAFNDVMVLLDAAPDCAWVFDTQPGAIRRIVMNLFGNALKYTEKGLIIVSLTQRSPKTGAAGGGSREMGGAGNRERQVTITVSDTGCGISEDFLRYKLFKPFSQENPLTPGTGLGLSLVKRIASQLRGRMSVQSRVGVGTSISVTLPLSVPAPAEQQPPEGRWAAPAAEGDAFARQVRELSGLRIRVLGFDCVNTLVGGERHDTHATIGSMCQDWLGLEVLPESVVPTAMPDFVLASEDAFFQRDRDPMLSRLPCVVVCVNALVAHQCSTRGKAYKDIVEFIYQPVGPRKLAKVLSLAFNRWAAVNAEWVSSGAESPAAAVIRAAAEPRGHHHQHRPERPPPHPSPMSRSQGSQDSGIHDVEEEPSDRRQRQRQQQQQQQEEEDQQLLLPVRPKLARNPTDASAQVRVLLVEDNPINLKILCAVMTKLGLRYHTATNGQEAVDAYERDPRQCTYILTDVSMPVMDGFESTRRIRAHEKALGLTAATIIALSGLASSQSQKEAFGSGMDLFLTKPVKFKELKAILRSRGLFR